MAYSATVSEEEAVLPCLRTVLKNELIAEPELKSRRVTDNRNVDIRIPTSFDFSSYEQDVRVSFLKQMRGLRKPAYHRKESLTAQIQDIFSKKYESFEIKNDIAEIPA